MSDLVEQFKSWRPKMSEQDRREALAVIEEQIAATMQNVQDAAKPLGTGMTQAYLDAWAAIVEKRRADLEELEQVKRILTE